MTRRIHRYKIKNINIPENLFCIPAAVSIKRYLNTTRRIAQRRLHHQRMRKPLLSLHDTYVHFCTVGRGMKQRRRRIPSFTVMASIIKAKIYTFTLHRHRERIALNGTTTRMASSARARRLVHRLTDSHCSLVTWPRLTLELIQSVTLLPGGEIRETDPDEPRSSNNREPCSLNTKGEKIEEKRRDMKIEDCEASRRWSALDLASVRSLAGPSCSPVLICFLLPSRHSPPTPLAAVPSSAIPPPLLGKRGV